MSTTIDERVVEMRFDNKHFENNVSTTMSTLDKLKAKLNLSGASKGLEDIGASAKKVDLSGISNSAETVGLKFNAMYTIADQALRNITNSAMAAGKRIVSALAIDPITTGFSEYETQINSTQTILANTASKGSTIHDVNKALEELNTYADKTIYNFTEMTRNIGTFTAAGIDLETSVNAIQGIANLAAVSGSTSQQASTAMYQLSQALASGTVKLMDWNSVVNAGMGGEMFQNALKETSELLGTGAEAAIKATGSFRESLREEWLTAEVLTETLKKFTTTGANERIAEYTGLSKEAVEAAIKSAEAQYGEAEAIEYASKALAEKSGKSAEEIKSVLQFAKNAEDAATKVKTFTQLWDVLKESAQSGWSQSWKIIVGDFEQAKTLLTPLADFLTGIINGISNWRNELLEGVLGSRFGKTFQALSEKINTVTKATDAVSKATKDYSKLVDEIIAGKWGNAPTRWQDLAEAGYDWAHAQNLVNERLGNSVRHATDYSEAQEDAGKATATTVEQLLKMSDAELENIGFTKKEIKALRELEEIAKKTGLSIEEILADPSKISGRSLLIESFKDIGKALGEIAKAIGEAWEAIFNPTGKTGEEKMAERVDFLYGLILSFRDFTRNLEVDGDKITRTFKGIFALLDIVTTIFGSGFKLAFQVISEVLSYFNLDILDVTANIGDAIVAFHDWLFSLVDVKGILDVVVPWIKKAADWIKNLYNTVKESDAFKKFCGYLTSAYEAVKKWITSIDASAVLDGFVSWITKAVEWCKNLLETVKDTKAFGTFVSYLTSAYEAVKGWISGIDNLSFTDIFNGIINGIKNFGTTVLNTIKKIPGMSEWIEGLGSTLKALSGSFVDWIGGIKDAENIPQYIIQGLVNGLKTGISVAWDAAVNLAKTLVTAIKDFLGIHSPSTVFMAIGGFIIAGLVYGLKNGFGGLWDTFSEMITTIVDKVVGFLRDADIGGLLAGGILGGLIYGGVKIANAISKFASPLEGVGDFLENIGDAAKRMSKGVTNYLNSKALLNLAQAILLLAVALVALTFVNVGKLWSAVGAIVVVGGVLAGLMIVLDKFNTDKLADKFKIMGVIVGIAGSLLLVAAAVRLIAGVETEGLIKAGLVITAFSGIIVGLMAATKLAKTGKSIDSTGGIILKIAAAMLLMVGVAKLAGSMTKEELIKGGAAILAFSGIIVGLMAATRLTKSGKSIDSTGSIILKVAAAMLLMVAVAKIAGSMTKEEMIKGGTAILAFSGIIVGLMAATKLAKTGKGIDSTGSIILKTAAAMLLMVFVAKIAASMSKEDLIKGTIVIAAFAGIIVGLIAATRLAGGKKLEGVASTILAIGATVAILAVVALLLGLVKTEHLAKGIIAVGLLSAIVAGLVWVSKGADGDLKNTLIGISIAIAVLAASVVVLSLIDITKLAGATTAITILLGMLAVVLKSSGDIKASMGALITLSVIIGLLGGLLFVLAKFVDPNSVVSSAVGLGVLLAAMAVVLKVLTDIGPLAKNAKSGIGALALLALVVGELAVILGLMSVFNVEASMGNVLALSAMMVALSGVLAILAAIGPMATAAKTGVGAMAILALVMGEVAIVLGLMSAFDVEPSIGQILGLSTLLLTLTGVLAILTAIGPMATTAYPAMLALAALIAGLVVVIAALGGLSKIPGFNELLADGGAVLGLIGRAIGSFVGGIVGGIAAGVVSVLPEIGLYLSQFMINATPFIVGAKLVDESVLAGVGILSAAIIALTAADLIAGVASFIQGGSSLATLGTELSMFMMNAMPFIMGASMISEEMVAGVKALAETILILTAANVIEGLTSWLTGGSSLETFATQLPLLAQGLASFKTALGESGFTEEDAMTVGHAANAVKLLAQAADAIPNSGGWLGKIVGENDLSTFAAQFPLLGVGLAAFRTALGEGGLTEEDLTTVKLAANAVKVLAEAADTIPNSGGWAGAILGENDLDTFAAKFPLLASGLVSFKTAMGDGAFTEDDLSAVECAANAVKTFASVAADIPNSGGWVAKLIGDNDLATFASSFPSIGSGLAGFKTNIGEWTEDDNTTIANVAASIASLAAVANTINEDTSIWDSLTNDFMDFVGNLPDIGTHLADFATNLGNSFTEDTSAILLRASNALKILGSITVDGESGSNLSSFTSKLPTIGTNLKDFMSKLGEITAESMVHGMAIVTNMSALLSGINNLKGSEAVANALRCRNAAKALKDAADVLGNVSQANIESAVDAINTLTDLVEGLVGIDVSGVIALSNALEDLASDSIASFADAFTSADALSTIEAAVSSMADSTAGAISDSSSTIKTAFSSLATSGVSGIKTQDNYNSYKGAGSYLASGLAAGIRAGLPSVRSAANALEAAAEKAIRLKAQIKSPSRVFYGLGEFVGLGFTNALYDYVNTSYNAGAEMADSAKTGLGDAISKIQRMLESDMDVQPTISPVLDLNNIQSGIRSMNNMLSAGSSLQVMSNVGAINSMMNRRSQNGSNSDIVSAIDRLRGDLGNNRGDTYNINGVTYDDGSNISTAVKTIVRAVRIGKRV